jgi:hypothetical protein
MKYNFFYFFKSYEGDNKISPLRGKEYNDGGVFIEDVSLCDAKG